MTSSSTSSTATCNTTVTVNSAQSTHMTTMEITEDPQPQDVTQEVEVEVVEEFELEGILRCYNFQRLPCVRRYSNCWTANIVVIELTLPLLAMILLAICIIIIHDSV